MAGYIDQVDVDMITNGVGSGGIAQDITSGRFTAESQVGFDPGIIRPVIMDDGKKYCKIKTGGMTRNKKGTDSYVANRKEGEQVPASKFIPLQTFINNGILPFTMNSAALPYLTWQKIDRAVMKAARERLQAWNDLAAANTYGGFDGMAVTALVKDTMTDAGEAKVDMETLSDDFNDAPLLTPDILPLPIIHAGAKISERRLAMSRNSGLPLDTTMIEQSGRRCAETLEDMTIGMTNYTGLVIGNDTTFTNNGIYGFRTQPQRITATVTTAASFVPMTFVNEVIAMVEAARAQNFYGPFILYYSTTWDQYMARDYFVTATAAGVTDVSKTVLDRVKMIPKIASVRSLDRFTSTDELLLVQMSSETVRAVNGMDFTTVQWSKDGGAQVMLRVLGIKVPDLRSQYIGTSVVVANRKCGIVHGSV